jgi:hypothetical protein
MLLILVWAFANPGRAADIGINSSWNQNLLSIELGDVKIKAANIFDAWSQMTTKYLLRVNIYTDKSALTDTTIFDFNKEKTTCKEILNAFLATYSSFTYTQNPETGIIWLYPKRLKYDNILNQRVYLRDRADEVPMYLDVYVPLCASLAPSVVDSMNVSHMQMEDIDLSTGKPPIPYGWFYDVDLPSGDYSARDILDFCCVANPAKAFLVLQETNRQVIYRFNLISPDPTVPPRAAAISFWEINIGKPINGIPSNDEVRSAMSNPDPKERISASLYVEACELNYAPVSLINEANSSDDAIWTALGLEYALWRDANTNYFKILIDNIPRISEDLKNIRNPDLALLVSLQLTREKQSTSYLDAIVSKHTYTVEEIASIKPELYRMVRSSKAVRNKLKDMKSQVPDLLPEALDELGNTNLFTLVPVEKN